MEQDVRVDGEPAGHADTLLLATGELRGVAVREGAVEADGVHQLQCTLPGLGLDTPVSSGTVAMLSATLRCGSKPAFCMT